MAYSAPLPGAGVALEPQATTLVLEHALVGAGRGARRLCTQLSLAGTAPRDLDERQSPLRVGPNLEDALPAWPWVMPGIAPPAECLVVQLYRFLAARLGGGVGELALAVLMLQRVILARPTWGQPRCLRTLVATCAILARKIVHEAEISTAECCDALADLLPGLDANRVGRAEWAIMTRLDWRVGTGAECQAFADGLFDCANETAAVQRAAPWIVSWRE